MSDVMTPARSNDAQTELPVLDFAPIEFYVGNAKQAAFFYNKIMGFDIVAYRGPETGIPETATYVLRQNQIQFLVTSALQSNHPVTRHVQTHGDSVKDIGFFVSEAEAAYQTACHRGAQHVSKPKSSLTQQGQVKKATVQTYGDTTHTFWEVPDRQAILTDGFEPLLIPGQGIGLERVDHIVGNVETMDDWVNYYERVFGFYVFRHFSKADISTQYSALVSKVMRNKSGSIKLPINEPAEGLKKSQIQEYLEFNNGAGPQHIAIATNDIIETVAAIRKAGLPLMTVPKTYYEDIQNRIGGIEEPLNKLAELGILIDRDEDGYLLQIFTQPVQDRPTFFFEIIQRHGSQGFGKGNFKALFEAIERDQAKRGNL